MSGEGSVGRDKRSKSVDAVLSKVNNDNGRTRRVKSDGDIQHIQVNISELKGEIKEREQKLEDRLRNATDQKKQLQELKILELKELLREKIEVTKSDEKDILDKFEVLIKGNMEGLDDTARKKISEGGIKSLKLDDKLKIMQDLSNYKAMKNEDIGQVEELQNKIKKEEEDIVEEINIIENIVNISKFTGDYDKQNMENLRKRDVFEGELRKMAFPDNKGSRTKTLEEIINVNKERKELLLEEILKKNVTEFTSREKKLIETTQKSDDKEYGIAVIGTLINIKEEEETFSNEYIKHYEKLYEDINNSSNDVSKVKAFRSNFEILKLFEDNFKNLKMEEREFEDVCKNGKIAGKIYVGYSYASGEIRNENFTKLNDVVNVSKNKYIKLLKSIAECGKNQEKDFKKYLVNNKKSILNNIKDGVKKLEKKGKEFNITMLNDLKKNLKGVENKEVKNVDIESLKKIINSFNAVVNEVDTLERKLKDSKDKKTQKNAKKLKNLEKDLKFGGLKKIDTMQQRLDYVQTYATEIVDVIRKMINDNKKDIQMKSYFKYLSIANEINDDSTKKTGSTMVDIIRSNEQDIKQYISDNMKVLRNMTEISLKEKIKSGIRNTSRFLKALLQGKVSIRTLRLQSRLKKVQRKAQEQEKKKERTVKRLSKQMNQ